MKFFVGLHQESDAVHFARCFISVVRLTRRNRQSDFQVHDWIMDSGAFSIIAQHGRYPEPVEVYARQIARWRTCGHLLAAVTQDYMCEPAMLKKTGLSVTEHQRLTIERYDALLACQPLVPILPVLQGYRPEEYVQHLQQYGNRLRPGQWTGVGSICKRNATPAAVVDILWHIKQVRPDLRLHGFGLKTTALQSREIRDSLESADSMAWSFAARYEGRNQNDWREARAFVQRIEGEQ